MFASLVLYLWLCASLCISYCLSKLIGHLLRMREIKKALNKLPSAKLHWAMGHLLDFPGEGEEGIEYCRKCVKERPRLDACWVGNWMYGHVRVWHPETAKVILKTSEPKYILYNGYQFAHDWLGDGLLFSSGKKWIRNRKLLTPAFHFEALKYYFSIKNHCSQILINKLLKKIGEESSVEMFEEFTQLSGDIALRCIFSKETDIQNEGRGQPYIEAMKVLSTLLMQRSRKPWIHPNWIYSFTSDGRKWAKTVKLVHTFSEGIIADKKKSLGEPKKKMDLMDILLGARDEDGKGMSDKEIRDEVDVMMFAGHDTTSSALTWTAYSLASNPQEQVKCQREVDALMEGRDSDEITSEDIGKLPYLTMCIKESMREHSIVPIISRELSKPLVIDGVELPAHTIVDVVIVAMNSNEEFWPEALKYKPERFLPDNVKDMDPYTFVPFSAGPRGCIGQHFAMNELKIVLARLLRRLTFRVDSERAPRHLASLVMKSENGVYLYIEERTFL